MNKKLLYGGAAALAAYFWWAKRSTATTATRTPSTSPTGTGFTAGPSPIFVVTTAPDQTVSNPPPVANPIESQGFTVGGVTTGTTVAEYLPTPAQAITADSQWGSQGQFNEYQRQVQGLGW